MSYIISLKIDKHTFFVKDIDQAHKTVSIEVEEGLAKPFDYKSDAWEFINLNYLKSSHPNIGVRKLKEKKNGNQMA